MDGKTVAVTGCTTGTGFALAKWCAEQGATVIMLNRPSDRATAALSEVERAGPGRARHINCDLSSFASVRQAATDVHSLVKDGLDALCNNAGVMALKDVATVDGYDIQMQTNHFGHFLLTAELMPLLEAAAEARGDARVVNHASDARKMVWSLCEANLEKRGGNLGGDAPGRLFIPFSGPRWQRYAQTKLANVCFTCTR